MSEPSPILAAFLERLAATDAELFAKLYVAGLALPSEDFVAMRAHAPTLRLDWLHEALRLAAHVNEELRRPHADHEALLMQTWACAHLSLLVGPELDDIFLEHDELIEPASGLPFFLGRFGVVALTSRAAWLASKLGAHVVDALKKHVATRLTYPRTVGIYASLAAIALRQTKLRPDVIKTLAGVRADPAWWADVGDVTVDAEQITSVLQTVASRFRDAIEDPGGALAMHQASGQTWAVEIGKSIGKPASWKAPEALAYTALVNAPWSISHDDGDLGENVLASASPWLALAKAEDLYLPEEFQARYARAKEPVRVAKAPGRNDPCSCGSGKKYKRCHGQ